MFEWNEEDGVTDAIWSELIEREDNIAPDPKADEDADLLAVEENCNKQKNGVKPSDVKYNEHSSTGSKNEFRSYDNEPSSHFHCEDLSDVRYMSSWSSFSSTNNVISRGIIERSCEGHESSSIHDFADSFHFHNVGEKRFTNEALDDKGTSLVEEKCSISLNGKMDVCGKLCVEHGQKDDDSFLNCDWGSITDFDDLDGIFRSYDSVLGHEILPNTDELMSPPDSIDVTAPTFHTQVSTCIQDTSPAINNHSEKRSLPSKINGEALRKRNYLVDGHVDKQRRLLKSQKKMEEKAMAKLQNINCPWSYNISQFQQFDNNIPVSAPLQYFPTSFSQQRQVRAPQCVRHFPPDYPIPAGFAYPPPSFHSIYIVPPVQCIRQQQQSASATSGYSCRAHQNSTVKHPGLSPRTLTMTPQEKIEKLRRRQQMQAMIAIKEQQKQFGGQHITCADLVDSQKPSQMNPSQDSVMSTIATEEKEKHLHLFEHDALNQDFAPSISYLSDDSSFQETIFSELQAVVEKMESNLRLCMQDSLFRLAKSAMERRSASGSSTKKNYSSEDAALTNEPTSHCDRLLRIPDTETSTNHIDRIVANLLFHRPLDSVAISIKDEIPLSPTSASNQSTNHGSR